MLVKNMSAHIDGFPMCSFPPLPPLLYLRSLACIRALFGSMGTCIFLMDGRLWCDHQQQLLSTHTERTNDYNSGGGDKDVVIWRKQIAAAAAQISANCVTALARESGARSPFSSHWRTSPIILSARATEIVLCRWWRRIRRHKES